MARVIDPVCGMEIDSAAAAAQSQFQGKTYYFCSTACAAEFDHHPAEILEQHEPPHTTKGGITAPKFGSAGSGGAEYERLPEAHGSKTRKT